MNEILNLPIKLYRLKKGKEIDAGNGIVMILIQNEDFSTNIIFKSTIDNDVLISADISETLNMQFKSSEYCAYFDLNCNEKIFNFSIIFQKSSHLRLFVNEFVRRSFEFFQQRKSTDEDEPELKRFVSFLSLDKSEKQLNKEYIFPSTNYKIEGHNYDDGKNTLLRIGIPTKLGKNTFVLRRYKESCDLGWFKLDKDCKFKKSLPNIRNKDGNSILADDILNTDQDKTLLILDNNCPNQVYEMNLTRGSVISQYDAKDSYGNSHELRKLIQTTADFDNQKNGSTFIAFSDNNTMLFDKRESNMIIKQSNYTENMQFACGKTTRNGHLAMGSENGVVRLYNGPCENKSMIDYVISFSGDSITSIDISNDEQWVLATCPYSLCVFNIKYQWTGLSFLRALLRTSKPPLTKLTIEPADQQKITKKYGGIMPQFSSAKFHHKNNKIESIIASIGNCLVSWDFRRIEQGYLPTYSIKYIGNETIIDYQPIDSENSILFMTDNSVTVIEKNVKE